RMTTVFLRRRDRVPAPLHPFPTRRSSDLDRSGVPGAETPESPDGMTRSDEERYAEVFNTWLRYGIGELDKEDRELLQARHVSHGDRKSTRLNSSHVKISYAVFCLKKKTTI